MPYMKTPAIKQYPLEARVILHNLVKATELNGRVGIVKSTGMEKTIVVEYTNRVPHPKFKKIIKKEVYQGLGNFSIMKKSDFIKNRMNQIIFLVEMIVWTYETETILEGEGASGLSDYIFQFNEFFANFKEFSLEVERSKKLTQRKVRIYRNGDDHVEGQNHADDQKEGRRGDELGLPVADQILHRVGRK